MKLVKADHNSIKDVIADHGAWSAMSIKLSETEYTKDDHPDYRLRRILQVAADTVGKPLDQCRVLDLACLEGQYAIEFALHGASAVGIELRTANVTKAAFAAKKLNLDKVEFYEDDVNNLNPKDYGTFDIIICSGILYHLRGPDAYDIFGKIRACCTGIAIIDTYVSVSGNATMDHDGTSLTGSFYKEHEPGTSDTEKLADLWASVENETSFWLDEATLLRAMMTAGFSSAHECLLPFFSEHTDRRTYVAMCGDPIEVRSSDATRTASAMDPFTRHPDALHPSQRHRSVAFKMAKTFLPQGIKDAIKPALRKMGVLDTQERPKF